MVKYYNTYRIFDWSKALDSVYIDLMDRFLRERSKSGFAHSLTRHDGNTLLSSDRGSRAAGGTSTPSAGAATSPSSGGGGSSGGY